MIMETLRKYGQDFVASKLESLSGEARAKLEKQLSEIDFAELSELIRDYVLQKPVTEIPADLAPAPFFPFPAKDEAQEAYYEKARKEGERLLAEGKVAFLVVAGGQGTRLGFDGPKGTYPITPIKHKTLFQYFAETISRVSKKYGRNLHWFIMTSELNDKRTREFFRENAYFGLGEENVTFFTQGTMPAISYEGKLLMNAPDSLALSPNGHGGTLLALKKSGALDEMKRRGVDYISYFQVDNPLAPMADPLFLGLHSLEKSEISSRMLPKTNPYEKLGNFCVSGGRLQIIEYSDMPAELAERRNPDGTLAFLSGSPAIHVISRTFVEELTKDGRLNMPWHRADKKVPYINENNELVKPEQPNAVKLESFIFDALPLAKHTLVLEGSRKDHFAPTKNATGVDSAESCRRMLCERDAERLDLAGKKVPRKADGTPDCLVEISPAAVCDNDDAVKILSDAKYKAPEPGSEVYYE